MCSLVVGTAGMGVILLGLVTIIARLFASFVNCGREIPDWACPRRVSSVPFFHPPGLAPNLEALFEDQRGQLVALCEALRDSFEKKKLHDEFGKLPAEFENLKEDFGRISDTFKKLDTVSDRLQGVSAPMQGLMSEFGRMQDLMEDTLLRNVQDSHAVLTELQGHSFEMKTSLTALSLSLC